MLLQLQDGTVLVPLELAEPDIIAGYTMDDPEKKPRSAQADFTLLPAAVEAALRGEQLQPILRT